MDDKIKLAEQEDKSSPGVVCAHSSVHTKGANSNKKNWTVHIKFLRHKNWELKNRYETSDYFHKMIYLMKSQ